MCIRDSIHLSKSLITLQSEIFMRFSVFIKRNVIIKILFLTALWHCLIKRRHCDINMTLLNQFGEKGCNRAELQTFLQLLSPFAPHICDEIWENHGFAGICSVSPWPVYDEAMCRDAEIDMAVQVNGKLRGTIHVEADSPDDAVIAAAQADEKVSRFLEKQGGRIVKTIVVKNKLVNLIVK